MNCVNCGAPMTLVSDRGYFACDYCGTLHFPKPPDDGITALGIPGTLECPLCKVPLELAWAGAAQVMLCRRCRGVLVPTAAFSRATTYLRGTAQDPPITPPPMNHEDLHRHIACPQCGRQMDVHPYGGPGNIVIDNCPHCQLNWLDSGEFQRVVQAPGRDRRRARD